MHEVQQPNSEQKLSDRGRESPECDQVLAMIRQKNQAENCSKEESIEMRIMSKKENLKQFEKKKLKPTYL